MTGQRNQQLGTLSWTPHAAGARRYGATGRTAAHQGPITSSTGQAGYRNRDQRLAQKKNMYVGWLKDNAVGHHGSANAQRLGR